MNIKPALVIAALSLFLSSCGDKEKNKSAEVPAPQQDKTIVVYSWDDYFNTELFDLFEKRTGVTVQYEVFESSDQLMEQLKSNPGAYDVIVTDDHTSRLLMDQRLLKPLPRESLPHFANLDEKYLQGKGGSDPGNKFTIPYMWGTTLIGYRTDLAEKPKKSWSIFFDGSVDGRVSLLDERLECYGATLLALGFDPNTIDAKEISKATSHMADAVANSSFAFGSDVDVKEHLIDGTSAVAMLYSGDAAQLADEHDNIDYFIPAEGAVMWIDSFAVPRDTRNSDEAIAFIDFMLEAEVAAESSNYLWYATPNKAAKPFLADELVQETRIYPPKEVRDRCAYLSKGNAVRARLTHKGWGQIRTKAFNNDLVSADQPES